MQFENDSYSSPTTGNTLTKERRTFLRGLEDLLVQFSPAERLTLYVFSAFLALSAFVLVGSTNEMISSRVPTEGGSITEGAVGTPRFANPLLATTQADEDLTMLVYSGLLRADEGGFIPDLATHYDISSDGATYTFHLREGLTFHDGAPLTADDVVYTVTLAQNPDIKSPRRADWDGVAVSAPDEKTVVFRLPHAYAPFLENATLGILPKEHWESVPTEEFPFSTLNTHPIGSGPYVVKNVELDATGAPAEYSLRAFKEFALGEPHITTITYRVFPSEPELLTAIEEGDIDSFLATTPKDISESVRDEGNFVSIPLSRVFGVFLNQNHAPVLVDASARKALSVAIDKNALIGQVIGGYGEALRGPLPAGFLGDETKAASSTSATAGAEAAKQILTEGGWRFIGPTATTSDGYWTKGGSTLALTIATPDTPELVASTEAVAAAWKAAGIQVKTQVYPLAEFNQTILRPRSYDAILFGEVVGRSLDLYPFWHSSQRNDPGLNFSLYTNPEADRALADARAATDRVTRETHIRAFLAQIEKDAPAIFLYSPDVAYLIPPHLEGVQLGPITTPAERFVGVHEWYRDTERVWDFFNH